MLISQNANAVTTVQTWKFQNVSISLHKAFSIECMINQWSGIHIDIAYLHQQLYTCATFQNNCRTRCLIQLCCDNALTGCCPDFLGLHSSSILYGVIYQHYLNYCFASFGSKTLVTNHYMIFANKIVSTQN